MSDWPYCEKHKRFKRRIESGEDWFVCDACEDLSAEETRKHKVFIHVTPNPHACKHDFNGYREFADGNGGEAVCTKCGIGAMEWTLRVGP